MISTRKLTDLPDPLLETITLKNKCYYKTEGIKEIKITNKYHIVTTKGEYDFPLDTDICISIG